MSSPSKDLKETKSTLLSVIQALIDGQDGFKKIGEQIKDETLKEYFLAESLTRAQFRGVLESILHQEGVHDVKESGTAAGTVRRAWADFKSALGGGDSSLLSAAEEGEDEAVEAYARANETYLPLPVRQVLASQAAHIEKSREFIKAARDTKK
ncbi:MAG: PA2169 family four-helix-bundle protein [Terracidiphilus sp.]